MMRNFVTLILWLGVALILAIIASSIADFVHAPCARKARVVQTAAVAGVLAQADEYGMFAPTDANGNPVDASGGYYDVMDEPCYDTIDVYDEPFSYSLYDDTYYYAGVAYSYPTYLQYDYPINTVHEPRYQTGAGASLTQTIVPIGTAVGVQGTSYTAPDAPVSTESYPTSNQKLIQNIVPIGVPTGGLNAAPQNPPTLVAPPAYYQTVVQPQTTQVYQSAPLYIAPPSCSISNYPQRVESGQSVAVAWYSSGAISASLSNTGRVPLSGSMTDIPQSAKAYTLSVQDQYGRQATCTTFADVVAAVAPAKVPRIAAPSCAITTQPSSIAAGDSVTLSWSTSNADSVVITGLGGVSSQGSLLVNPKSTQKYTLTATGQAGTRTCSALVEVKSATPCIMTCNGTTYTCTASSASATSTCPGGANAPKAASDDQNPPLNFWQWLVQIF